eukprot:TRINITY_DN11848_c0_g1_i1.p1 TRINITY_DN11848_c0_g1~~TRINITY_DN11848_c0_g1_i1.p1  ORF type:complete len:306 (-),score=52.13 TRINITY_DN11848_c0_g1_i1:133-1050(-)
MTWIGLVVNSKWPGVVTNVLKEGILLFLSVIAKPLSLVLFHLIHIIYNISMHVNRLKETYKWKKISKAYPESMLAIENLKCDISEATNGDANVPIHVGFILDNINLEKLARVLSWYIIFGIKYFTLHDNSGKLSSNYEDLRSLILANLNTHNLNTDIFINDDHGVKTLDISDIETVLEYESGQLTESEDEIQEFVLINITNYEVGRDSLVSTTRLISNMVTENILEYDQITDSLIRRLLSYINGFIVPLPDLVIKLDNNSVNQGYKPWDLRYAEIMYMGDIEQFSFVKFMYTLESFSKIEQRFGS